MGTAYTLGMALCEVGRGFGSTYIYIDDLLCDEVGWGEVERDLHVCSYIKKNISEVFLDTWRGWGKYTMVRQTIWFGVVVSGI